MVSGLLLLGALGIILLLSRVLDTAVLFLIAIVFGEGMRPIVSRVNRKIPLPLAILVTYVALAIVLALLMGVLLKPLVEEAVSLSQRVPHYSSAAERLLVSTEARFHISSNLTSELGTAFSVLRTVLVAVGSTMAAVVIDLVVVMVLAFMWLLSSKRLGAFVIDLFPVDVQADAASVMAEIGFRMGGYVRAVVINMVVIGTLSGVAALLLHLPSPLLLGIFSGLMEGIPILGPFLGAVPAVLLGFTVHPWWPLVVAGVYMLIQQIESNTLVPLVMNRVVALPALAVTLALLIGAGLLGVEGALLAIPVASTVQVLVLRVLVPAIHRSQGRVTSTAGEIGPTG